MTIRTLRVAPEAVLELVKAITAGKEIVLSGEEIPAEAALGRVTFNDAARVFEIDVVARWPKDARPDDVDFKFAVRHGPDLGAPRALGESSAR